MVVVAVGGGLMILGSPADERVNRLDARRVADLQQIDRAVSLHWTRQGRLPASLDEVSRDPGIAINLVDPTTMEPYAYRALDEKTFEVCAVFESMEPREQSRSTFWSHGTGRQCVRRAAREIR